MFLLFLLPALSFAQQLDRPWAFRARGILSGSSDQSVPSGYSVFSAITIEAGLSRSLGRWLGAEIALRTESHEVDFTSGTGIKDPLGSVELLPVFLLVQLRPPFKGGFRPYVGAGLNATVVWERSGWLDDQYVAPSLGPAVQLGADIVRSEAAAFNVDVRWNVMRTRIDSEGKTVATIVLDPLSLGLGIGFHF